MIDDLLSIFDAGVVLGVAIGVALSTLWRLISDRGES